MSTRMVSRGVKARFFGLVCICVLFLSVMLYVYHETKVQFDVYRYSASSCKHQLESISSQLQVIAEHKLKLERSLEEEKREHIKTKEELNAMIEDEKQLRDKQNVDSMNRYNEIKRNHEILQEEEKNIREELEKSNSNYLEEEKKNKQLIEDLNTAISQIQILKNEKVKSKRGKENSENDQNNNLDKPNEFSDPKFIEKSSDNINNTKLKSSSVTPAINPQAIDGATAKSSTAMNSLNVALPNDSPSIEKDETIHINQPSIDINSVNVPHNTLAPQNGTLESLVGENESMKAMAAPPQEETVKKEESNNNEEFKLSKQKNNAYKYDYEQDHFKEDGEIDKDDEDLNDFDTRDENQHIRFPEHN